LSLLNFHFLPCHLINIDNKIINLEKKG